MADLNCEASLLATVPVAETMLTETAFENGGYLESLVDQVTARDGVAGAYILVDRASARHPFQAGINVLRAYLRLCVAFSIAAPSAEVLVNGVGTWGLPCVALGASGICVGPSQPGRRIASSGLQEQGGRGGVPRLYSHQLIAELTTEEQLSAAIDAGLLDVLRDETAHSEPLFQRIDAGGTAKDVQSWAATQNNRSASSNHYLACVHREYLALRAMPSNRARQNHISRWLATAELGCDKLRRAGVEFQSPNFSRWRDVYAEELSVLRDLSS